ncbi:Ribosomal RNA small subunit methyltransferase E [Liberibacter crescens BT-1]|uniref:Ribosomal RNA small subunit methyltransferase E n=1 Tax=Liberibacter crescens (strain BT-1) TaxID=1215343 RepID=L0EV67_LIBCB|nr:16S rRNA (uracil(1498)-N(3))-methyltransferase [Liberibacter crescens]AGA64291.1 Ribosomal RNA small subunit methyltransferase E [Liberibacter crescens BT-1]AMC12513.1 16S rRNA methyltransferase [Liberibacter crescens]
MVQRSLLKRLFIEFPLQAGKQGAANEKQYHYIKHVLRMKEGEEILLFNGHDGEWIGNISYLSGKRLIFNIIKQIRQQKKSGNFEYLFSLLKVERLDYIIQKAVEMGFATIRPVITDHTQGKITNMNRLLDYAVGAAEQCGILSIPRIEKPIKLTTLLENWPPNKQIIFADERQKTRNPLETLTQLSTTSLAILIGPEGGFSIEERQRLQELPFVSAVSLGPRILRSDTAAVALMVLVQALYGDWRNNDR